jgi:hypothetical protein
MVNCNTHFHAVRRPEGNKQLQTLKQLQVAIKKCKKHGLKQTWLNIVKNNTNTNTTL